MLFTRTDEKSWLKAESQYAEALEKQGQNRLPELDAWYRAEFPPLLRKRKEKHVTLDELVRITEWKMKRGEWRARNLALVKANPGDDVKRLTANAFKLVPHPRFPIQKIAELGGVGPATASAVLATIHGDLYPFFDEIVAHGIPGMGEVKFTHTYYAKYAEALRNRAAELAFPSWDANRLANALWAHGALASG